MVLSFIPSRREAEPLTIAEAATTREIVETLGRRIANGFYAVGEVIPKEDQLAASLGVSRTTVRDAIKVLSGKSLVRTARRYGTRVQPVDDWNLLDPAIADGRLYVRTHQNLYCFGE